MAYFTPRELAAARRQATTDARRSDQRYCPDCRTPLNYNRGNVPNSVSTRVDANGAVTVVCNRCRRSWEQALIKEHAATTATGEQAPTLSFTDTADTTSSTAAAPKRKAKRKRADMSDSATPNFTSK